jgi:hypothetical protein
MGQIHLPFLVNLALYQIILSIKHHVHMLIKQSKMYIQHIVQIQIEFQCYYTIVMFGYSYHLD